jgi:drug/metabolite transporter (DMT)-like permease
VVITPFIAWVAMRRRPNALVWPAVALSAAGTWLLGGGALSAFSGGDGLVAASAAFWAMHVVIVGQAAVHARPIAFTCLQFFVVATCAALAASWIEPLALLGIAAAGPDILYVGVLSSALTFTLLTVALQYTPPSEAAVIVSLETLFAALGAYWLLGERLPNIAWIGAGLILLATLVIQMGSTKTPSPEPAGEHKR